MGNAQEVIEEYETRTNDARRVDIITKTEPNTYKNTTMILNHQYSDNGDVRYLTQWHDRHQRLVRPPQQYCFEWMELLKQYWDNQCSEQDNLPNNKP